MHKFFVKREYINNDVVEIRDDDFNHISNSLRLKTGEKIIVSTENKFDFIVKLKDFKKDHVTGVIIKKIENKTEPSIEVDIGQAIPKSRNIEFVIQKGTEIGANKFIPLFTKRTIVKLNQKKENKRLKRWKNIIKEAAKQSKRGNIPQISGIINISKINKVSELFNEYDLILILYTKEDKCGIKSVLKKYKDKNIEKILLLIGPEGGFSKDEVKLFKKINGNFILETITLGGRILRTETAGLTALSAILYEFGDLGG
ncbi:MAG: 16S rRNA (uracil(1498)-N(3))-methyltransferase [Halanaerobiales bacterium]|nr:16S rRNA (uracil(1498)-N(3))-methyltransferase [Halanaerobiales bacterium]